MLYDFSCTPEVFSEEYLTSEGGHFFSLINFLQGIASNGLLADLNNGDWKKSVVHNLDSLPEQYRSKLLSLFEKLRDQNLIVGHPKSKIKASSEKDWVDVAEISNDKKPFFGIVGSQEYNENVSTIEELILSQHWAEERTISHYIEQNEENMKKELANMLPYAKKVTLIDPYFNTTKYTFRKSLELVAEQFGSRRGMRQKGSIQVHAKYQQGNTDTQHYADSWKKISKEIFQKYGHICSLYLWDNTGKKMHDRFIITDQCGVQVGAGLDIRNEGTSTWSKLEYNTLSDILKNYVENSSSFDLKKKM